MADSRGVGEERRRDVRRGGFIKLLEMAWIKSLQFQCLVRND